MSIFILFCEYFHSVFENKKFEENLITNNLTIIEVLDITKYILKQIDSKYPKLLEELIKNGSIDFDYELKNVRSKMNFIYNVDSGKIINKLINTQRNFDLNDIKNLIHEFFHYINCCNKYYQNGTLLTEFISIYFEIYTNDYLIKNGYSLDELSLFYRYKNTVKAAYDFCWYDLIILAYEKFGLINENTYKILNQFCFRDIKDFKVTKKQFENECLKALHVFLKIEKEYLAVLEPKQNPNEIKLGFQLANSVNQPYKYIIGLMLALYARTYCTKEDILKINEDLIKENETNFIDLLKKNNINVMQDDFMKKSLDACQKYLGEMRNLKSEMSDKNENRRF